MNKSAFTFVDLKYYFRMLLYNGAKKRVKLQRFTVVFEFSKQNFSLFVCISRGLREFHSSLVAAK